MTQAPLTADEVALLPPMRPRSLGHVAGLVGVAVSFAYGWLITTSFDWFDERGVLNAGPWAVTGAIAFACAFAAEAVWLPLLRRADFQWHWVAWLTLFPIACPIIFWKIGFRLARMPYRDWRPSAPSKPTARMIPGTRLHVLEADLVRLRARQANTVKAAESLSEL